MDRYLDTRIEERINQMLSELVSHRPLKPALVQRLRNQFTVEMTYHSNAIEGNRLTLKETFLVLNEGVTIKGKGFKEHLEAKNHEEALHFLYELIDSKQKLTLSHASIRELHRLVVNDSSEREFAGVYRQSDVQRECLSFS